MRALLAKNLLVVVIAVAVALAIIVPGPALALQGLGLIPICIVLIFACQGAGVEARRYRHLGAYASLLAWGGVIAFVAAPAAGWAVVEVLGWSADDRLGFVLMCCMGPTLVSGMVIANQAGGEAETAALLTIVLNLVAVVTIPFTLALTVGDGASIDAWGLLLRLLLIVLLPAGVGQVIRIVRPNLVTRATGWLKVLPVALLGVIIYLALSEHAEDLRALHAWRILSLAWPALLVHGGLLVVAYAGARLVLRSDRARATAAAVVASQKTLPVAIAVWSTGFASSHPLALVPPIIFHLCQIYGDGLLAAWWARRGGSASLAATATSSGDQAR